MAETGLPGELKGYWLWNGTNDSTPETYLAFRREFTLSEIPASAELWVAANNFFHVFINQKHVGYGLNTHERRGANAYFYNIEHLVEMGLNTIHILAYHSTPFQSNCLQREPGIWAQLNIDDEHVIATDNTWEFTEPTSFQKNRPRRSESSGFTEKVNLLEEEEDWNSKTKSSAWFACTCLRPANTPRWPIAEMGGPEFLVESRAFGAIAAKGTWLERYLHTHVYFKDLYDQNGQVSSVYGGQSYIYVETETECDIELYCDAPHKLFVNNACYTQYGIEPLLPGRPCPSNLGSPYRQASEEYNPESRIALQQGWNQLQFFQEVEPGSFGMTLILKGTPATNIKFVQNNVEDAGKGWLLSGPMHAPLDAIFTSIDFSKLSVEVYNPTSENVPDEAAHLASGVFETSDEEARLLTPEEEIKLGQNEYIVLDVGTIDYGCPEFLISGPAGATVNILTGPELFNDYITPYENNRCNVETIVVSDSPRTWMAIAPRGVRYLMLHIQQAESELTISDAQLKVRRYILNNTGSFDCSREELNRIWDTSHTTLLATVQEVFLDSPTKEETQYIGDSMIQSWTVYHTFGEYSLAEKAITQFAKAQFETGEMPAAVPSAQYMNIADYPLLWPFWLHRHYMYTGNMELLKEVEPALENLFTYYDQVSLEGSDLLGYLEDRFGAFCFLDQSDIDRRGVVTGLNALYCRALLNGAEVFNELGKLDLATSLRSRAGRVAHQMRDLTWNEEKQLFADCWYEGELSNFYSKQSNVLAVYGSVARADYYHSIFDRIFYHEAPFEDLEERALTNPYFCYFVLEAAFAIGKREWAFSVLEWYWSSMLRRGARTWWELFDPGESEAELFCGDLCTGYGTSPNGFLITEIAGIRPARPGFSTIYFNPLVGSADSMRARIPTPHGHITVEWQVLDNREIEATLTSTYPIDVIPQLEPSVAAAATLNVNENINIYAINQ